MRRETEDFLLVVGAVAAGWWLLSKAKSLATAATAPVASGIAAAIEALTFAPNIAAAGFVDDLQGNMLGPVYDFPQATDAQGNTYLKINGATYQLGPRDSKGNFTAIPVTS